MKAFTLLALLGCGDNLPGFGEQSGTRLALYREKLDGAELIVRGRYRDTERDEDCTPKRWSDGERYCTPDAGDRTVFTDPDCTRELVLRLGEGRYAYRPFLAAGVESVSRLYEIGAPATEPADTYQLRDGRCEHVSVGSGPFAEIAGEVTRMQLVEIDRVDHGAGRLATQLDTSPDGLRAMVGLVDRELELDCLPAVRPGEASTECRPRDYSFSFHYTDPSCTNPELAVTPGTAIAEHALVFRPETGCSTFHDVLVRQPPGPIYYGSGGSCIALVDSNLEAYALGPTLTLAPLIRERVDGTKRMREIELGGLGFTDVVLHDSMLDLECAVDPTTSRCLPELASITTLYDDVDCLLAREVALVPVRSCDRPRVYAATIDPLAIHAIGEPFAGYEITTGDRCVPYIPMAGLEVHAVGPVIPLATFAEATLVADQRVMSKRVSPAFAASSSTATRVTRASGGPCSHQSSSAVTRSEGPCASSSTEPSGQFRTQPTSASRRASSSAEAR